MASLSTGCSGGGGNRSNAGASVGGASDVLGGAAGATSEGGVGGGNPGRMVSCTAVAAGDIAASVPSGTFQGSLAVELSTSIAGASIRYTTDGTTPNTSSTLYAGTAISVTSTTRLRAQAYVGDTATGSPSTMLYVARAIDAKHDLPVVVLDAYGSGKPPTDRTLRQFVDVGYLGFELSGGTVSLSSTPTVSSLAAFHVRGASSAGFDKISYRIELRNEAGDDRDCSLFGMPAESDWALVGPHPDKTLIRNAFVYSLGSDLGLVVPRLRLVEVYLNVDNEPLGEDDYLGVYQLVETIKNQKDRLNLKQLDETKTAAEEITGGYIFKFEASTAEEPILWCPNGTPVCWSSLELVDPVPVAAAQKEYLTQYLVSFSAALRSSDAANATTGYPAYIDVPSFVDTVIVNEFGRSLDAYIRSQYFYKNRGGKVFAGPLWDFDLIAGVGFKPGEMYRVTDNTETEGWQYEANAPRLSGETADWFPVLIADPTFKTQLVARWKELRQTHLSDAAVEARINTLSEGLGNAAERNFKRWPILPQTPVGPFTTPIETTWSGQLTQMKTWLHARAAWIDAQWK